jgi:predicted enzyme involved in methoxymalonyl-ACP biosynthesis
MSEQEIDKLSFSEIVREVEACKSDGKERSNLNVAFLRNITIDLVTPYLRFLSFSNGLRPEILMGGYDNVMQDVMDPGSGLYGHFPDVIVVCLKMEALSERLSNGFSVLSPK